MSISDLQTRLADQLYTCTDHYALQPAPTDRCCFAPTSPPAIAPAAPARLSAPWFSHRALQTLRQAGMQMRPRPRSWPEVLSLHQLLWRATANGLHPPGPLPPDQRVSRQLPSAPPDLGRDLRDQSRAVTPPPGTLRNRHESCSCLNLGSLRCRTWQPPPRQHALRLARPRSSRKTHRRGCA